MDSIAPTRRSISSETKLVQVLTPLMTEEAVDRKELFVRDVEVGVDHPRNTLLNRKTAYAFFVDNADGSFSSLVQIYELERGKNCHVYWSAKHWEHWAGARKKFVTHKWKDVLKLLSELNLGDYHLQRPESGLEQTRQSADAEPQLEEGVCRWALFSNVGWLVFTLEANMPYNKGKEGHNTRDPMYSVGKIASRGCVGISWTPKRR